MNELQPANGAYIGAPVRSSLNISRSRQVLLSLVLIIGTFFSLEVAIRVGTYLFYARSPYFLFYGLTSVMADQNPEGHSAAHNGYFKFQSSRTLHQYGMYEKPTPIRINSLGFRGLDFSPDKPQGIFRVFCLGGSSTFGFFNRDDYTYPAILQRKLRERLATNSIEVVNAGIPHANSDNLVAMLEGELVRYKPDVITIYAAYNDAAYVLDATVVQQFLRWLHKRSAIYVALKKLITAAGGPELYSRWATHVTGSNKDYVQEQVRLHVVRYEKNLREIVSVAQQNQSKIIFIRQPVNMHYYENKNRNTKMRYEEEVQSAQSRLEKGEVISGNEVTLLIHSALLRTLDAVANGRSIPLVDNVAILDQHPEYFASYVHLTEDGNRALADVLLGTILKYY